jgi:hypothetical protein
MQAILLFFVNGSDCWIKMLPRLFFVAGAGGQGFRNAPGVGDFVLAVFHNIECWERRARQVVHLRAWWRAPISNGCPHAPPPV